MIKSGVQLVEDHPALAAVPAYAASAFAVGKATLEGIKLITDTPDVVTKARKLFKPSRETYDTKILPADRAARAADLILSEGLTKQILADEKDPAVLKALASNPNLDPKFFPQLLKKVTALAPEEQDAFLQAVLEPITSKEDLAPAIQAKVVESSKDLPPAQQGEVLTKLASHQNGDFLAKVLERTKTLAPDAKKDALSALAGNSASTPDLQSKILEQAMTLKPDARGEVLSELAFHQTLALELQPKLLESLKDLPPVNSAAGLRALAQNTNLSAEVQAGLLDVKGVDSWDWSATVMHLAANPSLDHDVVPKLVDEINGMDPQDLVRHVLLQKSMPAEIQSAVLNQVINLPPETRGEVLIAMANTPTVAPEVQVKLIESARGLTSEKQADVLESLASNRNLDAEVRIKLRDESVSLIENGSSEEQSFYRPLRDSLDQEIKEGSEADTPSFWEKTAQPPASIPAEVPVKSADLSFVGKAVKGLAPFAKVIAPIGLAAPTVIEGAIGGYHEYENGGNVVDTTGSVLEGMGKGLIDTYLPSARNYYGDVIGNGQITGFDRFLNAANDATATGFAVGVTATGLETIGLVSIPAAVPTGIATGVRWIVKFWNQCGERNRKSYRSGR